MAVRIYEYIHSENNENLSQVSLRITMLFRRNIRRVHDLACFLENFEPHMYNKCKACRSVDHAS
jgi:hypothetical protein